jgi:heterodisulfide reductase subunit C
MEYNCCFFLNFVPLHIESPYNFGGKKPSAEGKWACCTCISNTKAGSKEVLIRHVSLYMLHVNINQG